jgi:putative nucleotidyltransferase with HDIG domain
MRDRIRQFREANRPPAAEDFALARQFLEDTLLRMFEAQHPRDIRHGAATARWLLDRGHDDHGLILAALLHDIGKGEQRPMDRVIYVLASASWTAGLLARTDSKVTLRRAVHRSLHHSEMGAEMLAAAGAPPPVSELTRLHHVPTAGTGVLALLQQADAAS